jgi:hypothetical protein
MYKLDTFILPTEQTTRIDNFNFIHLYLILLVSIGIFGVNKSTETKTTFMENQK